MWQDQSGEKHRYCICCQVRFPSKIFLQRTSLVRYLARWEHWFWLGVNNFYNFYSNHNRKWLLIQILLKAAPAGCCELCSELESQTTSYLWNQSSLRVVLYKVHVVQKLSYMRRPQISGNYTRKNSSRLVRLVFHMHVYCPRYLNDLI